MFLEKQPKLFATKRLENTVEASKKLAELGDARNKMKSSYYERKISLMERDVIANEEKVKVLKDVSNNLIVIADTLLLKSV